jgi:hypothetical protein
MDGLGGAAHKRRPKGEKGFPYKRNKTRIRTQERLVLILLLVGLYM